MSLVQTVLRHAHRIEMDMPWGVAVWHVWRTSNTSNSQPLVLLHGGSGSWTHWVKNVEYLALWRDVWVLDMPGFGDSALPEGVKDADALAPYIAQLLTQTFPQSPVELIGFSFVGLTAGLMAAEYPELVSNLFLVGVPGLGLLVDNLPMRGMLASMTDEQRREVHRHNLTTMMLLNPDCVTDEVIDLQIHNVDRDRMRRRRIARTNVLTSVQSQWQCPVHGIWGEHDALYKQVLHRVPQVLPVLASFQTIPHAGHWVQFEQPMAFHAALEINLSTS
jgi:pimeloyl-ACP methyl ester carboxylesterase